jgi:hypothetical protein
MDQRTDEASLPSEIRAFLFAFVQPPTSDTWSPRIGQTADRPALHRDYERFETASIDAEAAGATTFKNSSPGRKRCGSACPARSLHPSD